MLPYSFGLLLSILFGYLFSNALFVSDLVIPETFLRMLRIFFVWYIGSLLYLFYSSSSNSGYAQESF